MELFKKLFQDKKTDDQDPSDKTPSETAQKIRLPKYPVILVHGMMLKDFRFYHAFGGITDYLKERGVNVFVAHHDGIGSIENNAAQLKEEIDEILEKENAEKVNLIAHSKGGLDARYMISKLDMGGKVASLTTLSTPHKGSKTSSLILSMPEFIIKQINAVANFSYKLAGDKNPDLLTVGRQLCDTEMEKFNAEVLNDSRVYYQSYSAEMSDSDKILLFLPYGISKKLENEETDGIVSETSAQWGDYRGMMDVNAAHNEVVGVTIDKKKLDDVSEFYLKVIGELAERGF